jgi:hypothetical protein
MIDDKKIVNKAMIKVCVVVAVIWVVACSLLAFQSQSLPVYLVMALIICFVCVWIYRVIKFGGVIFVRSEIRLTNILASTKVYNANDIQIFFINTGCYLEDKSGNIHALSLVGSSLEINYSIEKQIPRIEELNRELSVRQKNV